MPALGMAQDSGVLISWLKQEGDQVTEGEPLMEIETDKAVTEVEANASGVLAGVSAAPGDDIPVGQVIAWILAPGEAVPETEALPSAAATPRPITPRQPTRSEAELTTAGQSRATSPVAARIALEHDIDLNQVPAPGGRVTKADVLALVSERPAAPKTQLGAKLIPASPKARRLASEWQLDIAMIEGSGPEGAVLAADILAARPSAVGTIPHDGLQAAKAPPIVHATALSRTWRLMAERLTQSWTSVPHFYLVREAEASQLIAWRERSQARTTENVTFTDLLVKLVAAALRAHPRVNAQWNDGAITMMQEINIGLAVAVEEGLVVPVLHMADSLNLHQIAARRREIVDRALAGKLRIEDISGGTFTISNLGMYGVDAFYAIVNPPQAAILAVGRIAERVVPVNGQPAVRPMIMLSLSFDHRVVDGARGAQFLQMLAEMVEDPLRLLD
jgi:pyruvate dehydrogenase E2 component (dihydrolipoamide acetyltransferase)